MNTNAQWNILYMNFIILLMYEPFQIYMKHVDLVWKIFLIFLVCVDGNNKLRYSIIM